MLPRVRWPRSVVGIASLAFLAVNCHAQDTEANHWAFRPLAAAIPPAAESSGFTAIDAFLNARLKLSGLSTAPQADRRTLARRLYLDLHGLPPSPELIATFAASTDPDSWPHLVDAALASPRFGERYAQHWLDVVRYADTDGFEVNTPRPNAWPYRDYVIRAFNQDKPFDHFVFEQLAGDAAGEHAATGLLVAAAVLLPGQIGQDDASKRLARQDALDEIVDGVAETFLALTITCARCHDHKTDPITQRDYYAFQSFFAGVEYGERPIGDPPAAPLGHDPAQGQSPVDHAPAPDPGKVFAGVFREPDTTCLLRRGDPEQPEETVAPGIPAMLGDLTLPENSSEQERRIVLARWIASPSNPLTARVIVNRIWQWHFGKGLVETPSEFGTNGTRPSHPELLDWLASELVASDWSLKHVHRLILLSQAYQQANLVDPHAQALDADCRLLWRFPTRRLEAEAIRDSILTVSGALDLGMGGPGFDFFTSRGGLNGFPPIETFPPDGLRRMIYAHKVRMEPVPVFGAFDCPDAGQPQPLRSRSTTALQALNLFNSAFVVDQAAQFAERIRSETSPDPSIGNQLALAFQLAYGRLPSPPEVAAARLAVEQHGLETLCRALLNSNEFLFIP